MHLCISRTVRKAEKAAQNHAEAALLVLTGSALLPSEPPHSSRALL